MALGIIGRKVGMTRIFNADGRTVPVTVVQAGPCPVVARREPGNGGYASLQLGYGAGRKVSKPLAGHFKKAGLAPTRILKEFRVSNEQMEKFPSGSQVGRCVQAAKAPTCQVHIYLMLTGIGEAGLQLQQGSRKHRRCPVLTDAQDVAGRQHHHAQIAHAQEA